MLASRPGPVSNTATTDFAPEKVARLKADNQAKREEIDETNTRAAILISQMAEVLPQIDQAQQQLKLPRLDPMNALTQQRVVYDGIQLKTQERRMVTEEVMKIVHTPGIFADNSPAFPDQFSNHCKTVLPAVRLYGNYVFSTKNPALANMVSVFAQHIGLAGLTCHDVDLEPLPFRRAMFMASFGKELFAHFENDSFDEQANTTPLYPFIQQDFNRQKIAYMERKRGERQAKGLVLEDKGEDERLFPAWYDWYMQQQRRLRYIADFKEVVETAARHLFTGNPKFMVWVEGLKTRLARAWMNGDMTSFEKVFIVKGEEKIEIQFLEACKQVWALHKMVRAFPFQPEMIRFVIGHEVLAQRCTSSFSVKEDENGNALPFKHENMAIVCTVFPGFQIDNSIELAETVWIEKHRVAELKSRLGLTANAGNLGCDNILLDSSPSDATPSDATLDDIPFGNDDDYKMMKGRV